MRRILAALVVGSLSGLAAAADAPAYVKQKELPLPGAAGFDLLSVDVASHRLLVAHSTRVEVVDLDKAEKVGMVEGLEGAHHALLVPGLGVGCVTEGKKNKLAVFDGKSLKVTREIDTGDGPDALLYVAATKEIWAFNHKAGTITCVDPATLEVKATIEVGGKLELAAEWAAKGLVLVNVEDKNLVTSIDAKKHAVVASYPLSPATSPTGIALDETAGVAFCGCEEKLAMLDVATGKVLATLPIGKHCDGVAFDPERKLAFASCGDGTTTVVRTKDGKTFEVEATIQTAPGARTCVLDPKTHALWVAAGTRGTDDLHLLEFVAATAK